jgi:hypothetical protein
VVVMASWPYTFFAIVPVTNRILALSGSEAGAARELVRTWGLLEIGQTAIGVVTCGVFLRALG